jgi:serine protease Do
MRRILFVFILLAAARSAAAADPTPADEAMPPEAIYRQAARSTVIIRYVLKAGDDQYQRYAVGVVITGAGLVLTTGDIKVPDATLDKIEVLIGPDKAIPAEYVGKDSDLELAVIRARPAPGERLAPVDMGGDDNLRLGDTLYAATSMGERQNYALQLETCHALQRVTSPFEAWVTDLPGDALRLDACAPVFSSRGKLVGVATYQTGLRKGMGVYPAKLWRKYASKPPSDQGGDSWLGVTLQALTPELKEYWKLTDAGGVIIGAVEPDSPSARAGMAVGDVVVALDGDAVDVLEPRQLPRFIRQVKSKRIGSIVNLTVVREGKRLTLPVTLEARPKERLAAARLELLKGWGLTVSELTFDILHERNLPRNTPGVMVSDIEHAGWAADAHLEKGDIIQQVGERKVKTFEDFKAAAAEEAKARPRTVRLFILRGADTKFVTLRPNWGDLDK